MSQSLSERSDEVGQGYAIEAQGLKFLREVTEREWEAIGRGLGTSIGRHNWAVGDWIVRGDEVFSVRPTPKVVIRGEGGKLQGTLPTGASAETKWQRAMDLTGLSMAVLQQCAQTARAYAQSKRVPEVSWSRHLEALAVRSDLRHSFLKASVGCTTVQWEYKLSEADKEMTPMRVLATQRRAVVTQRRTSPTQLPPVTESEAGATDRVVGIECPHCQQFIAEADLARLPRKERT